MAGVYTMIEPLEHVVEVLLRRRFEDILRKNMLHLHFEVVLNHVFQNFLSNTSLKRSIFQGSRVAGYTSWGWCSLKETLVRRWRSGRLTRSVHAAASIAISGSSCCRIWC